MRFSPSSIHQIVTGTVETIVLGTTEVDATNCFEFFFSCIPR